MESTNPLSNYRTQKLGYVTKFEIQAWLATLLVICFGVTASVITEQWHWFSRSGSLLILIGLLTAWKDLSGKFKSIIDNGLFEYLDYVSKIKGIPKEEVNADKEMFKKHSRVTMARIRRIEFSTIALGTFISGFGDLAGLLNHA